jgi:hypothetical protein
MRNLPSSVSSKSWPTTVANSSAASATSGPSLRPSSSARHAHASLARESISASRASASSQSIWGLAVVAYSSPLASTPRSSTSSSSSATRSNERKAERIKVMVSIVATASYNGVESNTRLAPTSPASDAASTVTAKIRRGSSEPSSRARMSTSTVCANRPHPPVS